MKLARTVLALVTLSLAAPSVASAAAPDKEPSSQFYVFDSLRFDGTVRGPGMGVMQGHRRVEFARLLSLKKDLVPGIFESRRDAVFK